MVNTLVVWIFAFSGVPAGDADFEIQTPIEWRFDYSLARKESMEKLRPLLIYFPHKCGRGMDDNTFLDVKVQKLVNKRFIPLRTNVNSELATDLKICAFPTTIFASPDGKIICVLEGALDVSAFEARMLQVLDRCNPR